ncbi:MAG TPA: nucleoside hydrolase, partial [Anaerolineae bacterium]|nr:nucleoside hydrolase [Anaerolineae bacterium]
NCDNTMGLPHWEVDDGLTLLYLLGRSDVELLGVTTTFGNGTIDQVYTLTKQLLCNVGHEHIPLFRGEGERGQPATDAARFLVEMTASHPGEITLLATGPLGNLRAAAELDPGFFQQLKQIVCMGGYLHPLRIGWRNVAELNLSADPEAAFAVLNAPCLVTLMNAHTCLQASFGWRDLTRIRHWGSNTRRIIRNWLLEFGRQCGVLKFFLWDLLPAVYISYPELFDTNMVWVRSSVTDLETGTIVLAEEGDGAVINMPTRILDQHCFKEILFEAWARVHLN